MSRSLKIILGILFYPYGLYLIYQYVRYGNKEKRDLRNNIKQEERIKERNIQEEPFKEKISSLYNEMKFFEVTDTSDFIQDIKKNEKVILDFGEDKLLKDFIKMKKFITRIENEIESNFNNIPKFKDDIIMLNDRDKFVLSFLEGKKDFSSSSIDDFYRKLRKTKLNLESMINYHSNFYQTCSILLKLLLNENKTDFYLIYDKFDEIGVFRTGFENDLLDKLNNIDSKLNNLSNQLIKLNNSINFQNMILTVNTFQLNSINKKLNN